MSWRNLVAVFWRETEIIRHDRNIVIVLLLAPAIYALFLGTIFNNKIETNVPIVVIDNDRTAISRTLIRSFDSHQLLLVTEIEPDFESAKEGIIESRAQAIVYIPKHFEDALKSGRMVNLEVYLNTARFLPSNDINKAVNEVALTIAAGIRLKYFQTKGLNTEQAKELVQPLSGDIRSLFNVSESYGDFLLPGLFILILQQTLLFGLSLSVAREREMKTLASLNTVSGGSSLVAVLGKGAPYFLLYGSYTIFSLVVFFSLFSLNVLGSMSALAVLMVLFLIAIIGFAVFVSSFFKQEIQALQFLVFSSMPLFLLSGYSWPVWAMPWPLRMTTQLLPSTPLFQVFVRVTQMGAGWQHIWLDLLHLLILAIGWIALAQWRIRHLSKS
ncbi:MAG: ABC transporter permease [candidate division Zixibacteria bacterium]|nr:ABC transporter permease [candidate division Zixibacteria bacterium]